METEKASKNKQEHTTIRLTLRLPDELDKLIREEAVRRGTNINQTMLYILNKHFKIRK